MYGDSANHIRISKVETSLVSNYVRIVLCSKSRGGVLTYLASIRLSAVVTVITKTVSANGVVESENCMNTLR